MGKIFKWGPLVLTVASIAMLCLAVSSNYRAGNFCFVVQNICSVCFILIVYALNKFWSDRCMKMFKQGYEIGKDHGKQLR